MKEKIETVLVATSLTEASDLVVRAGRDLARSLGARVHLAHAYEPRLTFGGPTLLGSEGMVLEEQLRSDREVAQNQLRAQIDRAAFIPGELAAAEVLPGPPHRTLVEVAERIGASMIVLGAAESRRLAKIFGSTAERVVQKAACPIFVVRGQVKLPLARVLFPVDLSALSAEALKEGYSLLRRLDPAGAARTEALFVIPPVDIATLRSAIALEAVEKRALADLSRFIAGNLPAGTTPPELKVQHGEVEERIVHRVGRWLPDMVVLGTHGRGGFERFLLGSATTAVLRQGLANVLVLPPAAARRQQNAPESLLAAVG